MIIKAYEHHKIKKIDNSIFLLYGENEGYKNQVIKDIFTNNYKGNIERLEESEILNNYENFISSIVNKSFFEEQKIILISRVSEKIVKLIDEILEKKVGDVTIILNAASLEKKSKIRSKFEKDKNYVCIAFYPDNEQTLVKLSFDFFRKNEISISASSINLIVSKCFGDRSNLLNELNKIKNYSLNNKIITEENINKLINLSENYSISELIDNCLAKNNKKIIHILNENSFGTDDSVLIVRTFLNKSKKILKLREEFEKSKNMERTISTAKPPIFWKDKEIIRQQIKILDIEKTKELVRKTNEIELIVKKNPSISINVTTDFILNQAI